MPSLEIREGAIDTLMGIWKSNLDRMGGYLAENGKVHLERAQVILEALAEREDEIFKKRREGSSYLSPQFTVLMYCMELIRDDLYYYS